MKKITFIIALSCTILIIVFTGKWFYASAAPYESEIDNNESAQSSDDLITTHINELSLIVEVRARHNFDAILLAQLVYGEASGIYSITEQACVMWTVLNRIDSGKEYDDSAQFGDSIYEIVTSGAYYYKPWFDTTDEYGRDLIWLAEDVLSRWYLEKLGGTNVGRVLPADYMWFYGDGKHNYFRNAYEAPYDKWDYSLPSPYES